ncbi:MAG: choice-of-anchor Q domain-containing protein [Marinicellaceae bacterium]
MQIKFPIITLSLLLPLMSKAVVFNVNTFDDLIDINPGDGICEATVSTGDCSLRAAINETNALPSADTIEVPAGTYVLTLLGNDDFGLVGDLDSTSVDLIISGAGMNQTIIDGGSTDRIFDISQSNLTIRDLTLQNGGDPVSTVSGGAMIYAGSPSHSLILERVKFDNNRANSAAGLYAVGSTDNRSQVSITESVFINNSTVDLGITNQFGPAIFCNDCDMIAQAITVSHSGSGQKAIRVEGGSLELINSTISHNQEGGIRSTNADVLVKFSTFYENGSQDLSFFSFDDSNQFQVGYSVFQTSININCQAGDLPESLGYNVTSDDSCEFNMVGDTQLKDAELGLLGANGGLTQTHLPSLSSMLINQVPMANCLDLMNNPLMQDQRGFERPVDSLCDIGSVELNTDVIYRNGFE